MPASRIEPTPDQVQQVINTTELSLALLGFMYYYLIQLPEQRRASVPEKEPQ